MERLTNEEVKELLESCQNKTHEEVQQILRTSKGRALVQEMATTIFPKSNKSTEIQNQNKN